MTTPRETQAFKAVDAVLPHAKGIAWDTCHKIYVLMDEEQMTEMRGYGYDPLIRIGASGFTVADAADTLRQWWEESCFLRFISAVRTNHEDPNAGFTSLIAQFELDEDEEE